MLEASEVIAWRNEPFVLAGRIASRRSARGVDVLAINDEDAPYADKLADSLQADSLCRQRFLGRIAIVSLSTSGAEIAGVNSPASNLFCGQLGRWRIDNRLERTPPTIMPSWDTLQAESVLALISLSTSAPGRDMSEVNDAIAKYERQQAQCSMEWLQSCGQVMDRLRDELCLCGGTEAPLSLKGDLSRGGIYCVSEYRGYLEDCGCKVGQFGGLLRLADSTAQAQPNAIIWEGNMLSWSDNVDQDARTNAVFELALQDPRVVAIAGSTELLWHLESSQQAVATPDRFVLTNASPREGYQRFRDIVTEMGPTRVIGIFEPTATSLRRETADYIQAMCSWEDPATCVLDAISDWKSENAVIIAGSFNPASIVRCLDGIRTANNTLILLASSHDAYDKGFVNHVRSWCNQSAWVVGNTAYGHGFVSIDWHGSQAVRVLLSEPVRPGGLLECAATAMLGTTGATEVGPLDGVWSGHFVGSGLCSACHPAQFSQWRTTKHARAFDTLEARQRQYAPGCVKCHVVGFGLDSGFAGQESLREVGCENCHGPGGIHVNDPRPGTIVRAVPITLCVRCHDSDHSDFVETRYLPLVVH
jgi:hypothetical protein